MMIAEVSKIYDLSHDTLRYYERIGLIPRINRNKSGIRNYSEEDCKWVEFIKCMRRAGLQIEALIEYVALSQAGDEANAARREILLEQRRQLTERMQDMQETMKRLDYKIELFDRIGIPEMTK